MNATFWWVDGRGVDIHHCPNCGGEVAWGEEHCPRCSYHPRSTGFRVAIGLLGGSVLLVLLAIVAVYTVPSVATYLLIAAIVLFPVAMVVMLFSFVVTPAALGLLRRS